MSCLRGFVPCSCSVLEVERRVLRASGVGILPLGTPQDYTQTCRTHPTHPRHPPTRPVQAEGLERVRLALAHPRAATSPRFADADAPTPTPMASGADGDGVVDLFPTLLQPSRRGALATCTDFKQVALSVCARLHRNMQRVGQCRDRMRNLRRRIGDLLAEDLLYALCAPPASRPSRRFAR